MTIATQAIDYEVYLLSRPAILCISSFLIHSAASLLRELATKMKMEFSRKLLIGRLKDQRNCSEKKELEKECREQKKTSSESLMHPQVYWKKYKRRQCSQKVRVSTIKRNTNWINNLGNRDGGRY